MQVALPSYAVPCPSLKRSNGGHITLTLQLEQKGTGYVVTRAGISIVRHSNKTLGNACFLAVLVVNCLHVSAFSLSLNADGSAPLCSVLHVAERRGGERRGFGLWFGAGNNALPLSLQKTAYVTFPLFILPLVPVKCKFIN